MHMLHNMPNVVWFHTKLNLVALVWYMTLNIKLYLVTLACVCNDPCCFFIFCFFLVSSLFSFLWVFTCHFLFPSVPCQSPVPLPSPVLILLRCSLSVIILSTVFGLLFASQSLSDPRRQLLAVFHAIFLVAFIHMVSLTIFVQLSFVVFLRSFLVL